MALLQAQTRHKVSLINIRDVLKGVDQVRQCLENAHADGSRFIIVAYEPVWSIGVNGTPAKPEYAEEMHKVIHDTLEEIFGEAGKSIPVLYGGSVNHDNAQQLIVKPHIDGLFVGRAAWDAEKFEQLICSSLEAY